MRNLLLEKLSKLFYTNAYIITLSPDEETVKRKGGGGDGEDDP